MTTETGTGHKGARAPPPQLLFDDGSRVMMENAASLATSEPPKSNSHDSSLPTGSTTDHRDSHNKSQRKNTSLHEYYEIDRISDEILKLLLRKPEPQQQQQQSRLLKVALQFPDELLSDSPEVSWLLENKLQEHLEAETETAMFRPFCFVLGDTTANACCPDEVAAQHLQADVLVHYGHGCLSPTGGLPVLYSFGKLELDIEQAIQTLDDEVVAARARRNNNNDSNDQQPPQRFLVLHQVGYQHAISELQNEWMKRHSTDDQLLEVIVGQIPTPQWDQTQDGSQQTIPSSSSGCCGGSSDCSAHKVASAAASDTTARTTDNLKIQVETREVKAQHRPLVIGGLELPRDRIASFDDLADFTVVFIMSDPEGSASSGASTGAHRQYINSMLTFLSLANPPSGGYWIYSPPANTLMTDALSLPSLRRQLKRRFFLTQKAKDATVFGLLVSNLSQRNLIHVVKTLQKLIQDADKTSYSFAVGKINPAKLANFAEIDVFCMIACQEHALLDSNQEREEYPIPVITPMELEIALGKLEWGSQSYSFDCQDVIRDDHRGSSQEDDGAINDDDGDDDADAPYFSLVTGGYVARKSQAEQQTHGDNDQNNLDLSNLPGKGQVTEYKSEAANFLKQREYQGLQTMAGQTEAKAAVQGLKGIASDYTVANSSDEVRK